MVSFLSITPPSAYEYILDNFEGIFIPLGTPLLSEGLGEAFLEGLGEVFPPLKVPCHSNNSIEGIESCGERNPFIYIKSC